MTWGLVVVRRLVWNMIFYYFYDLYNHTWKDGAMMGSREGLGDRGLRGRAPLKPIQVSFLKILFFLVFCITPVTQLIPPLIWAFFLCSMTNAKVKNKKRTQQSACQGWWGCKWTCANTKPPLFSQSDCTQSPTGTSYPTFFLPDQVQFWKSSGIG